MSGSGIASRAGRGAALAGALLVGAGLPAGPATAQPGVSEVAGWRIGSPDARYCVMQRAFPDKVGVFVAFAGDDVMAILQQGRDVAVPAGEHAAAVLVDQRKLADAQAQATAEGVLLAVFPVGYRAFGALQAGRAVAVQAAGATVGFPLDGAGQALPALAGCAAGLDVPAVSSVMAAEGIAGRGGARIKLLR